MSKTGLFLCLSAIVHLGVLLIPATLPQSQGQYLQMDEIELVDSQAGESTSFPIAKIQKNSPLAPADDHQKPQVPSFNEPSEDKPLNSFAEIPQTPSKEPVAPQLSPSVIPASFAPGEPKTTKPSTIDAEPQNIKAEPSKPSSNTQIPKDPSGVPRGKEPVFEPAKNPSRGLEPSPISKAEVANQTPTGGATVKSDTADKASGGPSFGAYPKAKIPQPPYPPLARAKGIEGTVRLSVEVLPGGRTGQVKIEKSSGRRDLDEAAIKALKNYHAWQPKVVNGREVSTWLQWEVQFRLVD